MLMQSPVINTLLHDSTPPTTTIPHSTSSGVWLQEYNGLFGNCHFPSSVKCFGGAGVMPRPSSPGPPAQSGQDTLFTSLQRWVRRLDAASTASSPAFFVFFPPSESRPLISAAFSSEDLSEECYTSIRHRRERKKKKPEGVFSLKNFRGLVRKRKNKAQSFSLWCF